MKLSIIIPYLNSHEIVRRQWLHFAKIGIPADCEFILVDDGSDPPHGMPDTDIRSRIGCRIKIHHTHDTRPWTWALARNAGARRADGDYLLMVDGDYILTREAIDRALAFNEDRLGFHREFGILDESGNFSQDRDTLLAYGLSPERIAAKGFKMPPHPNNFVMRKGLYWELGGYREDLFQKPYPQKEDTLFKRKLVEFVNAGKATMTSENRPTIYMFPNGQFCGDGDVDYNPMGLFHNLSRKTDANRAHLKWKAEHHV